MHRWNGSEKRRNGSDFTAGDIPETENGHDDRSGSGRGTKKVPLEEAAEAVSGDYVYLYPPGIPILVPGEMIDAATVETVRDCIRLGLEVEGLPDLTCINVVK